MPESIGTTWIFLAIAMWAATLLISATSARMTAYIWVESKCLSGSVRWAANIGFLISACGFTWCLFMPIMLWAYYATDWIPYGAALSLLALGYLAVIPSLAFLLFLSREKSRVDIWHAFGFPQTEGLEAYETERFRYKYVESLPRAFRLTASDFFGNDPDQPLATSLIMWTIFVLMSGLVMTSAIIRRYAGKTALPEKEGQTDWHMAIS